MIKLVWKREHNGDWVTAAGFGAFRIQRSRKTKVYYVISEPFGASPLVLSAFSSRPDAQRFVQEMHDRMERDHLAAKQRGSSACT